MEWRCVVLVPTLRFGAETEALRRELRGWLAAHEPPPPPSEYRERIQALIRWQAALHEAGFIGMSWPREYGGRGLTLAAEAVLVEELARVGVAELINRLALYTCAPTLLALGTPEQCARFLPGMRDASEIWCQGFSEPDAGSDLAAVRTLGTVDGDQISISGQKVWTSRADISKWALTLIRTDPQTSGRDGLSVVVVDMHHPGVTVRPLPQMLNEPHFAEVFFDDVRVPLDHVIGELGGGWQVAMSTMGHERGLFVIERRARLRRKLDELVAALRRRDRVDVALAELGRSYALLSVLQAQGYRTLGSQIEDSIRPGATSVDKLLLAEADQGLFGCAYDVLGDESGWAFDEWTHGLLESRSVSIYSGTSEIQRNIIARQLLGLRTDQRRVA